MTREEALKFEHLCSLFSSLNGENKRFTLDISKDLLAIQKPVTEAASRVCRPEPQQSA